MNICKLFKFSITYYVLHPLAQVISFVAIIATRSRPLLAVVPGIGIIVVYGEKTKQSFCSVTPVFVVKLVSLHRPWIIGISRIFSSPLTITKHGLLKKMKGLQKYIVSPYGGNRSLNHSGIQHEYIRARNGKKYKISAILCKGSSC